MMRWLRSTLGVAAMGSRWIIRQPMWLLQSLGLTAAFALMLYAWGGIEALRNIVIAWVVAGAWALGVNLVGQNIAWERLHGQLDMLIASPLTPGAYIAGMTLGSMLFMAFDAVPLAALAAAIGAWRELIAGIAAALLLLPVSVFTGLAIAMSIRNPGSVSAATNTVASLLQLLPPVFYTAAILPPWLRPVALITPTSAAAELARSLSGLPHVYTPADTLAALTAWLVLGAALATRTIKWGLE